MRATDVNLYITNLTIGYPHCHRDFPTCRLQFANRCCQLFYLPGGLFIVVFGEFFLFRLTLEFDASFDIFICFGDEFSKGFFGRDNPFMRRVVCLLFSLGPDFDLVPLCDAFE